MLILGQAVLTRTECLSEALIHACIDLYLRVLIFILNFNLDWISPKEIQIEILTHPSCHGTIQALHTYTGGPGGRAPGNWFSQTTQAYCFNPGVQGAESPVTGSPNPPNTWATYTGGPGGCAPGKWFSPWNSRQWEHAL